jgi:glycine hydroxymethyltransferase
MKDEIFEIIQKELVRQQDNVELIASENIVSKEVLEAAGSVLTNKYAEGYPGRRYYGGCEFVDEIEQLAINRAKELFDCSYANVQPHSGSQANQAVMLSIAKPGDTYLSMSLNHGGHLTHGSHVSMSGMWFNPIHYQVKESDQRIDYDHLLDMAKKHKPKFIIAGGSAYPRSIDFAKFKEVADLVGAKFWVDMAHFAGLVAVGEHESPLKYADIVTSTTHKTLRGPRGGIILSNNEEVSATLNKSVFPGLQGGPLMHIIAAKAVAFGEALRPEFKDYIKLVIKNAKIFCDVLQERGYDLVSGGTDTHVLLVDLRKKGIFGNIAEKSLERANIACNKNFIPYDPTTPMVTSGLRFGTAAITTRGFKEEETRIIAGYVADVLDSIAAGKELEVEKEIATKVTDLCRKFPIYAGK